MRKSKSLEERMLNKVEAYWKGLNPTITIENPNKEQTNKRFIKTKANEVWGNPKDRKPFVMTKDV